VQSKRKHLGHAPGHARPAGRRQGLRRGHCRRRSGGPGDGGVCRVGGALGHRAGCPVFRRSSGGQCTHRKLLRLSHGHHRPGIDRACFCASAEVRREDAHSDAHQAAGLFTQGRRSADQGGRGHAGPGQDGGGGHRRTLPSSQYRCAVCLRGAWRLVLGIAHRGEDLRRPGGDPGGRRQFGRPGRRLPVGARGQGAHRWSPPCPNT
jgi:hypothetical protein